MCFDKTIKLPVLLCPSPKTEKYCARGKWASYNNHIGNLTSGTYWAALAYPTGQRTENFGPWDNGNNLWDASGSCLGTWAWRYDGHPLCQVSAAYLLPWFGRSLKQRSWSIITIMSIILIINIIISNSSSSSSIYLLSFSLYQAFAKSITSALTQLTHLTWHSFEVSTVFNPYFIGLKN